MEVIDIGSVVEGDRLQWQFPPIGDAPRPVHSAKVKDVIDWGHSKAYDAPYVNFYEDTGIQRAIALPFIIKKNGRRVDREYWAGRLPELDLQRQPSAAERIFAAQLRIPLNEEDIALATLKTSTRKGLDEMSDSHRAHIEKWEPHMEKLGGEHVWASANRFAGRGGEGPVYIALKRGSKDYVIVDYNTEKQTKAKVLADGFETSKAVMEAFKEYRTMAKEEKAENRAELKEAAKSQRKTSTKAKASTATKKKAPAKRKPTATRKKATRKK